MMTENVTIDRCPPDIIHGIERCSRRWWANLPTPGDRDRLVGNDASSWNTPSYNVSHTIVMTSEGGGIYFAQIPAQNRSMELTYRIVAEDKRGYATTEHSP